MKSVPLIVRVQLLIGPPETLERHSESPTKGSNWVASTRSSMSWVGYLYGLVNCVLRTHPRRNNRTGGGSSGRREAYSNVWTSPIGCSRLIAHWGSRLRKVSPQMDRMKGSI